MEKEDRLKIINQYIGFGNPDSKIWILGAEETKHGPLNDDELIIIKKITGNDV